VRGIAIWDSGLKTQDDPPFASGWNAVVGRPSMPDGCAPAGGPSAGRGTSLSTSSLTASISPLSMRSPAWSVVEGSPGGRCRRSGRGIAGKLSPIASCSCRRKLCRLLSAMRRVHHPLILDSSMVLPPKQLIDSLPDPMLGRGHIGSPP